MAFTLIETKTLGTAVTAVTFNSIPQTFTNLWLEVSIASTTAGNNRQDFYISFNSDTPASGSYTIRNLFYDGANKLHQYDVNNAAGFAMPTTGYGARFTNFSMLIPSYTNTSYKKCVMGMGGYAAATTQAFNELVVSTGVTNNNAVTSLVLTASANNIATNSVISLYGTV